MSGLSLFQIEDALIQLFEAREETADPIEIEVIEKTIVEYVEREVSKVDNIRGFLKHCEFMAAGHREEANTQAEASRVWERRGERMKAIVKTVSDMSGRKRFEGRTGVIRLQANGGQAPLNVTDPGQVPTDLCKYVGWIGGRTWYNICEALDRAGVPLDRDDYNLDRVVDNDRVRKALGELGGVPGAHLGDRGEHVRVV